MHIDKIRSAIRRDCERDKGSVLILGQMCSKTRDLVSETLLSKNLESRDVSTDKLPVFYNCTDLSDAQVEDVIIKEVAKHLTGGAGPSGVYSSSFSQWLLKYGGASAKLRKTLASLVEWLTNSYRP